MTLKNQILTILLFTLLLSGLRLLTIDDPSFTIIKKQKISPEISLIPEEFTEPMSINLDLAKNLFDDKSAIFIDARDVEEYNNGHIFSAINIPFDYYDDYEAVLDSLQTDQLYVIYCNGEECSLSLDLAEYLFNELLFEKVLIYEGGWPEWKNSELPSSTITSNTNSLNELSDSQKNTLDIDFVISLIILISGVFTFLFFFNVIKLDISKISLVNRMVVGFIFIYASYSKILDPISFSDNIHNYHIAPIFVENIVALFIPALELVVGIFLILGVFLEASSNLIIGMLVLFILMLSQAAFRGIDVHCGCFKTEADSNVENLRFEMIKRIIEDIILLGMTFIIKMKDRFK